MIPSSAIRSMLPRHNHASWRKIMLPSFNSPLQHASYRGGAPITSQQQQQHRYFSEDSSSRLHSTDIAFKPAESGWGGGSKYTQNYDAIFGGGGSSSSSNGKKGVEDTATSTTTSDNNDGQSNMGVGES